MEMPVLDEGIRRGLESLSSNSQVQLALAFLESDNLSTVQDQMEIAAISAPTFFEKKRGEYYRSRLEEVGLEDVTCDDVGNVYGIRRGSGNGPTVAVFAHLDTVFPMDTPVIPQMRDGKIYGPGIADDSRGLATVLTILRALCEAELVTVGDIIFGATVCEEGLGDLRGVKAFCNDHSDLSGFIALEPGVHGLVTYQCTGSRRYNVSYNGPGGHSFNDFGQPSAIHAMGRAIAQIADLKVPSDPKTTFNVGVVQGGSSVNTLAASAEMLIDLRSVKTSSLSWVEEQVLRIVTESVTRENERWDAGKISLDVKKVGDRPAGMQDINEAIVQTATASGRILGFMPTTQGPKGTDANVPLSLGIPAITLGCGGDFGGVHSLQEWFDPANAFLGPQQILLTIMGLVGQPGVSVPLLKERKNNA